MTGYGEVTFSNCTFKNVQQRAEYFGVEFKVVDLGDGQCQFLSEDYDFMPDIEATRIKEPRGLLFVNYYCAFEHIGAFC